MALPQAPIVPMTVAEYTALPEDGEVHYELQEGVLVAMPSPVPEHQICIFGLMRQLEHQIPSDMDFMSDVDIDLQIVPAPRPGFVRRPDIVVVTRAGIARRRGEGGVLRASEVVLAVEIVSVGSERTDRVIKHGEYADAGIGHCWMVDLTGVPSLTACRLAGGFGYADATPAEGTFTTEQPFPTHLDLTALR